MDRTLSFLRISLRVSESKIHKRIETGIPLLNSLDNAVNDFHWRQRSRANAIREIYGRAIR